jgi:hypothetical protein
LINIFSFYFYSPITVYAVVKETGKRFEIRYSAKIASEDNPIIAIIYVDGINDYTYRGLSSSSPQVQSYFWNSSRDKKYCFNFSGIPTLDSPESSPDSRVRASPLYGAHGTISVYFYKALKESARLKSTPYYTLNRSRIPIIEPRFKSEIKFITKFDEIFNEDIPSKPIIDMIKQSNDPIAVLHIHYRSEPWLISIGMPIKYYENSSTECTQNNGPFKSIPTVIDRNELDSSEVVDVRTNIANNQSVNNTAKISRINDQVRKETDKIKFLIQSFEKLYNDDDFRKGICNNMNNVKQKSVDVEIQIPDENNNTSTGIRFENSEKENQKKRRKQKQKQNRKRKLQKKETTMTRSAKKRMTQPPKKRVTQPPEKRVAQPPEKRITQTSANVRQEIMNLSEKIKQEITNPPERIKQEIGMRIPKYKEYVKREYHTSDYIEFDDNDQVLKKKTYCIEKTIIDLEDEN